MSSTKKNCSILQGNTEIKNLTEIVQNLKIENKKKESKLPSYVKNIKTTGYKQPSVNYELHQSFSSNNFKCNSQLWNSSSISINESSTESQNLIKNYSHESIDKISSNKTFKIDLTSKPNKIKKQKIPDSSLKSSDLSKKKFNLSNKTVEYEKYMPLCKVQKMLAKGDIVEGVLKISQKNFGDAYISSPVGKKDINIRGFRNINRTLDGDIVAVKINPIKYWKILFNEITNYWDDFKDEIIDILKKKNKQTIEIIESNKRRKKKFLINNYDLSILSAEDLKNCSFVESVLQKTGKVVHILQKVENRKFCGKLKLKSNSEYAMFLPTNLKLPICQVLLSKCPPLFILNPDSFKDTIFLAKIQSWHSSQKNPIISLEKTICESDQVKILTEILFLENNIDTSEFPDVIYKDLSNNIKNDFENFKITKEMYKKRKDLTQELVFTIDPSTAKDLDDALSVKLISFNKKTQDYVYEIGVHISDVSYFVKEGLLVDKIAQKRTISFYSIDRVIPMLPSLISEKFCSLNPNEEKLTFSVFWHMNQDGIILKQWFDRTIIKSAIKLSYEDANNLIGNCENNLNEVINCLPPIYGKFNFADLIESLKILNNLATKLQQARLEKGALEFMKNEITFVLDPVLNCPTSFVEKKSEYTFVVKEFMLLANIVVANKIYKTYPDKTFLRCHQSPSEEKLKTFFNFCSRLNLDFEVEFNKKNLQTVFNKIKKKVDTDFFSLISIQLLKTMNQAVYFSTMLNQDFNTYHHYALNEPLYTHFTSPIRRYPDIIVHRLLLSALNLEKLSLNLDSNKLSTLINRCNKMKSASKVINESSQKIFLSMLILNSGYLIQSSIVFQVNKKNFDCYIPSFNMFVQVQCDHLDLKSYEFNKNELKLFYKDTPHVKTIKPMIKLDLKLTIPDKNKLLDWKVLLS